MGGEVLVKHEVGRTRVGDESHYPHFGPQICREGVLIG